MLEEILGKMMANIGQIDMEEMTRIHGQEEAERMMREVVKNNEIIMGMQKQIVGLVVMEEKRWQEEREMEGRREKEQKEMDKWMEECRKRNEKEKEEKEEERKRRCERGPKTWLYRVLQGTGEHWSILMDALRLIAESLR